MKTLLVFLAMAALAYLVLNQKPARKEAAAAKLSPSTRGTPSYVFTSHRVEHNGIQEDYYTVAFANEIMTVRYHDSQTNTAKPGDPPGAGLHPHIYYHDADLSQIPALGVPIRQCELSKGPSREGSPVIAAQAVPDPCMAKIGDNLRYEPEPNAGKSTYVTFSILTEEVNEGLQ